MSNTLLALLQVLALERFEHVVIAHKTCKDGGTLGVDVVAEILGVNTRIGRELLLIERLHDVERGLGAVAKLAVTLYLKRGEIEELLRRFCAVFLLYRGDGERLVGNG